VRTDTAGQAMIKATLPIANARQERWNAA